MITADDVTDDQLLELRLLVESLTATALGEDGLPENHRLARRARARCAEILNALANGKP